MPKGKECRRRRPRRRRRDDTPNTDINDLPDDLLEQVLLHIRSPLPLFRAAATCKRWRRVVAGAGFLARFFRSLHTTPHHLLGHYYIEDASRRNTGPGNRVVFRAWPRGRPPGGARQQHRLSIDFVLPTSNKGVYLRAVTDSRHGLLAGVHTDEIMFVCNPWTREHTELDLSALREPGKNSDYGVHCLGAFLLDADAQATSGPDMLDFRVLWVDLIYDYYHQSGHAVARVFSARDNRWIRETATDDDHDWYARDAPDMYKQFLGRAGGSIFWSIHRDSILALNETTGEFSTLTLPPGGDANIQHCKSRRELRVIAAAGCTEDATAVLILRIVGDNLDVLTPPADGGAVCVVQGKFSLLSSSAHVDEEEEVRISSGSMTTWSFVDTASTEEDSIELVAVAASSSVASYSKVYSLDVETMTLERTKKRHHHRKAVWRVFSYQLPLPQTIDTCL